MKMKELPNGVVIFNATPHVIRFWDPDWPEPVEVPTDEVIDAEAGEVEDHAVDILPSFPSTTSEVDVSRGIGRVSFVRTEFRATDAGRQVIAHAHSYGDAFVVVVGSIIAAQAYPGEVVAMVPAPGYERVVPDQKRMRPDKFTVF